MAQTVNRRGGAYTWEGEAVDFERIEGALARLRELSGDAGAGYAVRTSLVNMVIYSEKDEAAETTGRVLDGLARHHPSRAIVVIASPSSGKSRIEASLAAHCHTTEGNQNLCCEQVTLRVSGEAARHLHSVVVPLLVPDLPVVVWWAGDVPEDVRQMEQMCTFSHHFVIDSEQFADLAGGLETARSVASRYGCAIGDLSFERTRPWRELFDQYASSGGLGPWLESVRSLEVRYAQGEGDGAPSQAQSLLVLAWLAGRMGLRPQPGAAAESEAVSFVGPQGPVPAYVIPADYAGAGSGWLVSVKAAFSGTDDTQAIFTMSRTADPLHVTARAEYPEGAEEDHFRIETSDTPRMIARQLDAAPHDKEFVRLAEIVCILLNGKSR